MTDHHSTLGLACLILALLLAGMYILATPARSQEAPCAPRAALEKQIAREYGESVFGAGVTPVGILYITMNPQTGTFTVLMRRKDGQACIIGGGKGWASVPPTIPGTNL